MNTARTIWSEWREQNEYRNDAWSVVFCVFFSFFFLLFSTTTLRIVDNNNDSYMNFIVVTGRCCKQSTMKCRIVSLTVRSMQVPMKYVALATGKTDWQEKAIWHEKPKKTNDDNEVAGDDKHSGAWSTEVGHCVICSSTTIAADIRTKWNP